MNKFIDKYATPVAIIIAGLFIAGTVLLINFYNIGERAPADLNVLTQEKETDIFRNAQPISADDHILGNPDASIKVLTYADMICPACVRFKETMQATVEEYGGEVAWVVRHFPLNPRSMSAAQASECVVSLLGKENFWTFMNAFSAGLAMGEADPRNIAITLGVEAVAFDTCYNANQFATKIDAHMNDGSATGLRGTPHNILFVRGEPVGTIDGAQPIENVRAIIDQHL